MKRPQEACASLVWAWIVVQGDTRYSLLPSSVGPARFHLDQALKTDRLFLFAVAFGPLPRSGSKDSAETYSPPSLTPPRLHRASVRGVAFEPHECEASHPAPPVPVRRSSENHDVDEQRQTEAQASASIRSEFVSWRVTEEPRCKDVSWRHSASGWGARTHAAAPRQRTKWGRRAAPFPLPPPRDDNRARVQRGALRQRGDGHMPEAAQQPRMVSPSQCPRDVAQWHADHHLEHAG